MGKLKKVSSGDTQVCFYLSCLCLTSGKEVANLAKEFFS